MCPWVASAPSMDVDIHSLFFKFFDFVPAISLPVCDRSRGSLVVLNQRRDPNV